MKKYKILLVDDEPFILNSLTRLLRSDRVSILTACSAAKALEVVKSDDIQLVITDNLMPGMSGVELVSRIKECSPDTIRCILSGQSDIDAVLRAVNEGEVFRFILKPWNDMDLKATASMALAHYKLAEDNRRMAKVLDEQTLLIDHFRETHPEMFDTYELKTRNH